MVTWMDGTNPGYENTRGRKLGERCAVQTVMYWSRLLFHKAMVPPFALYFVKGSELSRRSSENSLEKYSPLNRSIDCCSLHWNNIGSLRNMKSGEYVSRWCLRQNLEFTKFSIVHEIQLKVVTEVEASDEESELSGGTSLKGVYSGQCFPDQKKQNLSFQHQRKHQELHN